MNEARRKQVYEVSEQLEAVKALLETLRDEEQEAYDNMPEGVQAGERGSKIQEAVDALGEGVDNVDSAISNLATAVE